MKPEPRGSEGTGFRRRRKVGLETPLIGRFVGEDRRLVFAPPAWYESLVLACLVGSVVWLVWSWTQGFGFNLVAVAVLLSGLWAALSSERIVFDLRSGTFLRREGQGLFKRIDRGPLTEIDAVVLTTEVYPVSVIGGQLMIYRLLIHWKGARLPVFVAERQEATVPAGEPMNRFAGGMLQRGQRYAKALGVPFYDNSYYASPPPVRPA